MNTHIHNHFQHGSSSPSSYILLLGLYITIFLLAAIIPSTAASPISPGSNSVSLDLPIEQLSSSSAALHSSIPSATTLYPSIFIPIGIGLIIIVMLSLAAYKLHQFTNSWFIWKDIRQIFYQVQLIVFAYKNILCKNTTIDVFEDQVNTQKDNIFLIQNNEYWSYNHVNRAINRLAWYLSTLPIQKQDTICILLENKIEYIIAWHAILKVGCVASLINIHCSLAQIRHCVETANPVIFITDNHHINIVKQLYGVDTSITIDQQQQQQQQQQQSSVSNLPTIVPCIVIDSGYESSWLLTDAVDMMEACFQYAVATSTSSSSLPPTHNKTQEYIPTDQSQRQTMLVHVLQTLYPIVSQLDQSLPVEELIARLPSLATLQLPDHQKYIASTIPAHSLALTAAATATDTVSPTSKNTASPNEIVVNHNLEVIHFATHIAQHLGLLCIQFLCKNNNLASIGQQLSTLQQQHQQPLSDDIIASSVALRTAVSVFSLQLITLRLQQTNPPRKFRHGVDYNSLALLIYTSGTTGLPKAAIIRHSRVIASGHVFVKNFQFTNRDRLYTVLPLYHSAGGVCSVYGTILTGGSLVVKKKLSTRDFWRDCCQYQVTIIQYIGELCRYLINTSPITHKGYDSRWEQQHHVRLAYGNGLRSDIWLAFQERFKIPVIGEFYASTEGNVGLFVLYDRQNHYHKQVLQPFYQQDCQYREQQQQLQQEQTINNNNNNTSALVPAATTDAPIAETTTPRRFVPSSAPESHQLSQQPSNQLVKSQQEQIVLPPPESLKEVLARTQSLNISGFGSIGHNGIFTRIISGFVLVKYDVENDDFIRNKQGFCIQADWNEPGLLLAPIINWDPIRRYNGYYNKNQAGNTGTKPPQNDKKLLSGIFKPSDQYFNTGDILTLDRYGYWRFVDRIGDTFRWKSENVSTQEVEALCNAFRQSVDIDSPPQDIFESINCFGVEVPGQDGRGCMLALTLLAPFTAPDINTKTPTSTLSTSSPSTEFDLRAFYAYVSKNLSPFSRPLFIRIITSSGDNTGTFKLKKQSLRLQGAAYYNTPQNTTSDIVFIVDHANQTYRHLTPDQWDNVVQQKAKL